MFIFPGLPSFLSLYLLPVRDCHPSALFPLTSSSSSRPTGATPSRPLPLAGDFHSAILPTLLCSFLHHPSDEPLCPLPFALAWTSPSRDLIAWIDQIECGLRLIVSASARSPAPSALVCLRMATSPFGARLPPHSRHPLRFSIFFPHGPPPLRATLLSLRRHIRRPRRVRRHATPVSPLSFGVRLFRTVRYPGFHPSSTPRQYLLRPRDPRRSRPHLRLAPPLIRRLPPFRVPSHRGFLSLHRRIHHLRILRNGLITAVRITATMESG